MRVLSPSHLNTTARIPIAPRGTELVGKNWGFVDTSKVNADLFIEEIQRELRENYQPKSFVTIRKEAPGFPLTAAQLDQLQSSCDVVVLCFGD